MTHTDRINHLNSALMIASVAAAFLIPFELFLFAYAVLGPLHYLTEISWIHDRRYFVGGDATARRPEAMTLWLFLVGVTLAAMIFGLVMERVAGARPSPLLEIGLFYMVFVLGGLLVFRVNELVAGGILLLAGFGLLLFSSSPAYGLIAFFLITIIHVLVFTFAFLLQGALKSRSLSGIASVAIYLCCIVAIFLVAAPAPSPGAYIRTSYEPFETLNAQLIAFLGLGPGQALAEIYESPAGATVMRLIAFAYTYHYLNWFTKTSVIGWNRIPRARAIAIVLLWLAAVALYAWNYLLGFAVLFILSALHVMLELPLNHQSFAGIGRELGRLLARAPAPEPLAAGPSLPVSRKAARRASRHRSQRRSR